MRLVFPRSLLARNIALLLVLVALTQVTSFAVLLHFVQRPRIERAATIFSEYVLRLDAVLAATPADEVPAAAARLGGQTQPPSEPAEQTTSKPFVTNPLGAFQRYQRSVFLDTLQHRLPPDMAVRWQTGGAERLWIRLHAPGGPLWIALPISESVQARGVAAALLLSVTLALLAALTGYLIQLHINRPLRDLARAARNISAGKAAQTLPTDGPTEIAAVSGAFNQMTQALQQAEATRALMLAGVSHDIRTPLTKLRLAMAMAMPRGTDDTFVASVEDYLDHIDTILQQFMDYAGSGEREIPQPGELNALVSQLAADFAGLGHEFELSLGEVPVFAYRPVSVMRLLMNLMQNAVVYGRSGFFARTWAEGNMAYVAVCDRGSGISAEELEQLKTPFSRGKNARSHSGGTGLGLAIVERIARLHGGSLQFRAREGGGLEAVVALAMGGGNDITRHNS
jgi:two-component system osmolarity sensor histidine kinase EnvZ